MLENVNAFNIFLVILSLPIVCYPTEILLAQCLLRKGFTFLYLNIPQYET